MTFAIKGYDHVGIRVSDRERALAFYQSLGFAIDPDFSGDGVAELVTPDGARINLIFNGVARPDANNVLMDEPVKMAGLHPCRLHRRFAAARARLGGGGRGGDHRGAGRLGTAADLLSPRPGRQRARI